MLCGMHEVNPDGRAVHYHYEDVAHLRPARCQRCGGNLFVSDMLNFTVNKEQLGRMPPLRPGRRPREALPAD